MKKKIIDEIAIKIKSGNGGNGKKSFHREKYVDMGGPSGGNGGNGGSIYFIADKNENNFYKFNSSVIFRAENGGNGSTQKKSGKNGKDLFINVPIGTEIIVNDNEKMSMLFDKQLFLIQKGGRGGRGNYSFKSSKNTTPTLYENGEKTKEIEVKLNLKILADVGIVGYPNSGKSTFVSKISNAKTEIANYEFTTINPKLGVVNYEKEKFIIADLPGIIDGASSGKGMGFKFLKHASRTKIILHFISVENYGEIEDKYNKIRNEIKKFSKTLYEKKEIIVITKIDLINEKELNELKKEVNLNNVFFISSQKNNGIESLIKEIVLNLKKITVKSEEDLTKDQYLKIELKKVDEFKIDKIDNIWEISGEYPEYWGNIIPLDSYENYYRIILKLKSKGIIKKLKKYGIKDDEFIKIKNTNFIVEYQEIDI